MPKFGERLKELMEDRCLTAPQMAKIINVDRSTVTRYLSGERTPDYSTFILIIGYFNCSADFIIGLADIPPEKDSYGEVKNFGEQLRFVMESCGFSQYKLENEKNYSGSVIYNWLNNIKLPNVNSLERLAKDLECSVDFLLGRVT